MKGSLISVAFLDSAGSLMPNPTESWRDEVKETRERSRTPTRLPPSGAPGASASALGPSDAAPTGDTQFAVVVSEKQGRLISMPSQTCLYRVNLAPEGGFVVTSSVVSLKGAVLNFSRTKQVLQIRFSRSSKREFRMMKMKIHLKFRSVFQSSKLKLNIDS